MPEEKEDEPTGMLPDELRSFRMFQKFMRQGGGSGPGRFGRTKPDSEDEGDGRSGAPGPPPSWDGTGVFEDYLIKAKLWIATTKAKP